VGARVEHGYGLLSPLFDAGPQLTQALLALARQLLYLDELLLHGQQVRFHVATHLHQIGLLRREGLLQSREQRAQRIEARRLLGGRLVLLRPQGLHLKLDLPDVPLQGASGGQPQAQDER
jgi:hypothetical protein